MKQDVLEQIVEDWPQLRSYFTVHNIPFKPRRDHPDYVSQQDSVASDIDVLAVHPLLDGVDRVAAVICKSWQAGFDASARLSELRGEKTNPEACDVAPLPGAVGAEVE